LLSCLSIGTRIVFMLMVTPSQLWSEPHGILVEKS